MTRTAFNRPRREKQRKAKEERDELLRLLKCVMPFVDPYLSPQAKKAYNDVHLYFDKIGEVV